MGTGLHISSTEFFFQFQSPGWNSLSADEGREHSPGGQRSNSRSLAGKQPDWEEAFVTSVIQLFYMEL